AGDAAGQAAGQAAGEEAASPSFTSDQNRREVTLFFQEKDAEYLAPERRKIFLTASPADQAKQIIGELIQGPRGADLLPTIPKDTRLRGLYLDRAGTAYVDMSGEFASGHPGGTAEEIATLFSLVNSLTYNLPEIKRVHLMIDGEERDAFVHLDLLRNYRQDLSIVDMERGKAG
ncbi:MAG: GerMN domain-containing protein, partial [Candidatus Polarisedimenticolia bacterium]